MCFYTSYIGARDTLVTFDDPCPTSSVWTLKGERACNCLLLCVPSKIQWFVTIYSNSCCLDNRAGEEGLETSVQV